MIMLKGAPVSSPLSNDDDTSADHRVATAPPPETRVWCEVQDLTKTRHTAPSRCPMEDNPFRIVLKSSRTDPLPTLLSFNLMVIFFMHMIS